MIFTLFVSGGNADFVGINFLFLLLGVAGRLQVLPISITLVCLSASLTVHKVLNIVLYKLTSEALTCLGKYLAPGVRVCRLEG
jgi:hypothetical protein